jgi:hypothetical protein
MSITKVSYSMINGAPANPLDFGAVGDGVANDTTALQTFINYCRDNNIPGAFPQSGQSFRITTSLVTQYDGNYGAVYIDFNNAEIVADFENAAALIVTGGAYTQTLLNVNLKPSATYEMNVTYSNRDALSHGITVTNTIVKITGVINRFSGHGYLHFDTGSNSNTSQWDLTIGVCNYGCYFQGDLSSNNLSVCTARFNIQGCAASAFRGESNVNIRNWVAWIYAEDNCQADTAAASITVLRSQICNWWIYSEQANVANEIDFSDANNTVSLYYTARNNKDSFNIAITAGNQVQFGGFPVAPFKYTGNGTAWSPTLTAVSSNPTLTGFTSTGYWTRIGNIIYASFNMSWTAAAGGSGILRIGNFPTAATLTTVPGAIVLNGINTPASTVSVAFAGVTNGGNFGVISCTLDTGAQTELVASDLQAGAASLFGSVWYFV